MKKFEITKFTTKDCTFHCNFKTLSNNEELPICKSRTLYDCYAHPSNSKIIAYNYCVIIVHTIIKSIRSAYEQCSYDDYLSFGYDYGISAFNTNMFTFNANFYKDNILIGRLHCTHTKTELELADDYIHLFDIEYLKGGEN